MTKRPEPNRHVMNLFQHLVCLFSAFSRRIFHPRPQEGVFRCDFNKDQHPIWGVFNTDQYDYYPYGDGYNKWGEFIPDWYFRINSVPEPSIVLLMGSDLLGLVGLRMKFKK